jgi:hypothetical protein
MPGFVAHRVQLVTDATERTSNPETITRIVRPIEHASTCGFVKQPTVFTWRWSLTTNEVRQ